MKCTQEQQGRPRVEDAHKWMNGRIDRWMGFLYKRVERAEEKGSPSVCNRHSKLSVPLLICLRKARLAVIMWCPLFSQSNRWSLLQLYYRAKLTSPSRNATGLEGYRIRKVISRKVNFCLGLFVHK